jgi:hypothetical protein
MVQILSAAAMAAGGHVPGGGVQAPPWVVSPHPAVAQQMVPPAGYPPGMQPPAQMQGAPPPWITAPHPSMVGGPVAPPAMPSAVPAGMSPAHGGGGGGAPWEKPVQPTAPPSDPDVASTIKKLADYVNKNGADFERMMREKQTQNAKFSFLFGGDGFEYYRWCKHAAAMNMSEEMVNAQVAVHQSQNPGAFKHPTLTDTQKAQFMTMLDALTGTKENIKAGQKWFFEQWKEAREVMGMVLRKAHGCDTFDTKLFMIYIINDVVRLPSSLRGVRSAYGR